MLQKVAKTNPSNSTNPPLTSLPPRLPPRVQSRTAMANHPRSNALYDLSQLHSRYQRTMVFISTSSLSVYALFSILSLASIHSPKSKSNSEPDSAPNHIHHTVTPFSPVINPASDLSECLKILTTNGDEDSLILMKPNSKEGE